AGRLVRMTVDGDAYLHVRTLSDHQRVDGRWTPRCPVCAHANSHELTRASVSARKLEQTPAGKESKGKESNVADASPPRRGGAADPGPSSWMPTRPSAAAWRRAGATEHDSYSAGTAGTMPKPGPSSSGRKPTSSGEPTSCPCPPSASSTTSCGWLLCAKPER